MARLSQYPKDTTPHKQDSFLTLDSATGNTTRIDIVDIAGVVADQNLLETADSALFHYNTPNGLDYTVAQSGLMVVNPVGTNSNRLFSTLTQLVVSKAGFNAKNISTYLNDLNGYQIKVSQLGDLNSFGIYEVTNVEDYTDHYIKLTLSYQDRGSGNLNYGSKYYISHHQTSFDQDFSDNSVTEFGDVFGAGSGYIISDYERARVNEITQKIFYSDIVDDVVTNRSDKPLSAAQGLVLKGYIDSINTLLTSDNVDLNSLQEVVDFIEANKTTLDTLTISNIAGLQTALDSKVDKIVGKALSENDFTDAYRSKLDGIEGAAEVNVQANYTETDPASDAYIQNKPTDVTDLSIHSVTELNDISTVGSGNIITDDERNAITGLTSTGLLDNNVEVVEDLRVGQNLTFLNPQTSEPAYDNAIYYSQENGNDVLQFKQHGHRVSLDNITSNLATGILSGGILSVVNGTDFQISAGSGVVVDFNKEALATDPHPILKHVSWASQTLTTFNLDASSTSQKNSWVYIDDTGAVQQQNNQFTEGQYNSAIPIGSILHASGANIDARSFPSTAYANTNQFAEFARLFGPLKKSGHEIQAVAGTLSISRLAGVSFAWGRNYSSDPNNPSLVQDAASISPIKIHRYYQDGSGGFVKDTNSGAGYTTLDVANYDNGSGVPVSVSNNKFSIQRIYHFPNNPNIAIVYYGRKEYTTLDEANTFLNAEKFEEAENTASQAIYLGAIIAENTASDLSSTTNVRIIQGGVFRSVSFTATGAAASAAALGDLADVSVQSPSEGQLLTYNTSTLAWNNFTPEYDANAIAYSIALGG